MPLTKTQMKLWKQICVCFKTSVSHMLWIKHFGRLSCCSISDTSPSSRNKNHSLILSDFAFKRNGYVTVGGAKKKACLFPSLKEAVIFRSSEILQNISEHLKIVFEEIISCEDTIPFLKGGEEEVKTS